MRVAIRFAGLVLLGLLVGMATAQTTTYTGTIKDLSGNPVATGQVTFTLAPSVDSTVSGTARFVPLTVTCMIGASGQLTSQAGGACQVTQNTALSPNGTSYRVCIQPYFATPGSCFYDYAVTSTKDISTVAPTLQTGPLNYSGIPGPPGAGASGPDGSGIYDLSTYPGSTGDQKLVAADAALAGIPAIITVTHAVTFYNSVTMSNGHWLNVVAPIASVGDSTHIILPQTDGGVMCAGGAGKITSAVHDGTGFFWTAPGTTNVAINGCNASGGDAGTFLVYTAGGGSNIRLSNIVTSGIGGHLVLGGTALTSDLSYSNLSLASANWGIYLTGPNVQRVQGVNTTCNGILDCIEGFAINAAGFPNQAQILAANSGNWVFTNTDVHNATACAYTNGNYNVSFIGGSFDGNLGDTCLDPEGSMNVRYFDWNITKTNGNFALSTFFSSYGNEYHKIRISESDAQAAIRIKYDGGIGAVGAQNTKFDDININCSPTCYVLFEGNVGTIITNANWTDVQMLTIGNASVGLQVYDSWFNWNVAVPTGSGGFVLPTQLNGGRDFFQRNHIVTTVSQTAPALLIQSADFNSVDSFEVGSNWNEGPWGTDFQFSNTGGNVPALFNFINNHTQSNSFVQGTSNAGVGVYRVNNCTLYEAVCDSQARTSAGWGTNSPNDWNGSTGIGGNNYQFSGRVIHNDEVHDWSPAATTAGVPNDWRTGVDPVTGVRTFSICPIGFASGCTVLQQFLPNGVFRLNMLAGTGNQIVCADASGGLYRGTSGACGTPPSSLTAMPNVVTTPAPGP